MVDDSHVLDLLPDFALGQLEDADFISVAAHLETCVRCQASLEGYNEMLEVMPLAVPLQETPPGLEDKVVRAVNRERAGRGDPAAAPQGRRPRLFDWLRSPAWGLASLLLLVLLAGTVFVLWDQVRQPPLDTTLASIALQGSDYFPDATAVMIVGGDGSVGTMVVDKLAVLEEAQVYQLWLFLDGEYENAGLVEVDEDGYGVKYIHADRPLLSYSRFNVTIEPEGGSPSPTGHVVLEIDL